MSDRCIFCGAKAVRWCDFVLGFEDTHGDGLCHSIHDAPIQRCDAPLCEAHAVNRGWVHYKSPRSAGGGFETIDHCIGHPDAEPWGPLKPGQAEQLRHRHRCSAAGPLHIVRERAALGSSTGD